ncbi:hypothetical protein IWW36_000257 [Coemansia brasiliensis]|uniref:HTH APSES-type domain-containing protein n=1 Tax=Coemansia brasiliensis TaxID=2650707 RepID=A0A9W8IB10_9FUNG|nr:hypothetical protein IWW36_000257 [Coemansia brasiliensis]
MSTLHTQYNSSQTAAGGNGGASGAGGMDAVGGDAGAMGSSSGPRDAVAAAAAAAAAAAVASNGAVLSTADYARGYSTMAPGSHSQMLPPPTQLQSQQGHAQPGHQAQHQHSLPSMDMNGHAAAAAAVAGYHSSYGLADGSTNGMVNLMGSPTATSWGPGPTSPLSPHSTAVAAANAALAAGQQHQSPGAWYGSMYQQSQYSPASHNMVMYHDGYAQSPTAAAAAAAAAYYPPRARLTTTLWEDEQTLVYQVDCRGICVARRHDDNMINGTKLLNVVGMSRGKRDGILKNEKGRRVVKVGPMHLKGVWIPFDRARFLAEQFKVLDVLFPIFQPDPNTYLYGTIPINSPTSAAGLPAADPYSTAAAGYSQLAPAQDAYPNATPASTASSASHSHTASLSQVMAHQSSTAHSHHHSMSQSSLQSQQQQTAGLGISYIASPQPRIQGISSPPPTAGGSLAMSPSTSYSEKSARYAPYGTSFQATASKSSGAGSKRGSIDHHYNQMHVSMKQQQPNPVSSSSTSLSMAAKPSLSQNDPLVSDQDGLAMANSVGSSQQPAMNSSYFDNLLAKSEQ